MRGFSDRSPFPLPGDRHVWQQQGAERLVLPYHLDSNAATPSASPARRTRGWMSKPPGSRPHERLAPPTKRRPRWATASRSCAPSSALANAFTLCDAYHCSIHAGTNTNRLFHWTGTNGRPPPGRGGGDQRVGQLPARRDRLPVDNLSGTAGQRRQLEGVSIPAGQLCRQPLAGFANTAPPAFRWAIRRGRRKTSTPSCPTAMRSTRLRRCIASATASLAGRRRQSI
ncbi:hypothetical protein M8494_27465 [Serratia ureilytica]